MGSGAVTGAGAAAFFTARAPVFAPAGAVVPVALVDFAGLACLAGAEGAFFVAGAALTAVLLVATGLSVALLLAGGVGSAFVSDWFVAALSPAMDSLHLSDAFAGLVVPGGVREGAQEGPDAGLVRCHGTQARPRRRCQLSRLRRREPISYG